MSREDLDQEGSLDLEHDQYHYQDQEHDQYTDQEFDQHEDHDHNQREISSFTTPTRTLELKVHDEVISLCQ